MARSWIDDLAAASATATEKNKRHNEEIALFDAAVDRVNEEFDEVITALNARFSLSLAKHKGDGTITVAAKAPVGKYKSAKIFVDVTGRRLTSQPEGSMSSSAERHEFKYDFERLAFTEANEEVSVEELVRRALYPFLEANVAATK